MRRNFRRHTHRNARCAIEQYEWQTRRQQGRLLHRTIVVRHEIHCAHVQLIQQQRRNRRQTRLGITHRRRAIAIARTEVPLPVNQRIAQRKILRQTHQRLIRGRVTMRVKFTQHITDHTRRFDRFRIRRQTHFMHRIENPPLNRLLPIRHIGQSAPFHHRNRVIQIRTLGVLRQ